MWLLLASVLAALAAWQALQLRQQARRDAWLNDELAQRAQPPLASAGCTSDDSAPLKLLVLGQSNAGNHGPSVGGRSEQSQVQMQLGGACVAVQDPLPGASGNGASIWSQLPEKLRQDGLKRTPRIALLAIQSTTIEDWARPSSPLNQALRQELKALSAAAWVPDMVLWQQGEADVLSGTSSAAYIRSWEHLLRQLKEAGVHAPVLLARSTHCQLAQAIGTESKSQALAVNAATIRGALQTLAQQHDQLQLGPDTDALADLTLRRDGCHFSTKGLDAAAQLWSEAIVAKLHPKQAQ
ncbi:sialate O-acetylesterase [Roseateles sp.]|uniref:sialate O-acetylesterase n=1 Tax=Roseateles sp. TaxID=1971397 RepID=UPI003D14584F